MMKAVAVAMVTNEEWAEALRSGEYRQGVNTLNRGGAYCCIGVRGDLFVQKGYGEWRQRPNGRPKHLATLCGESMTSSPPDLYINSFQITKHLPRMRHETEKVYNERLSGSGADNSYCDEAMLVLFNDSGFTFEQIADIIEYFQPGCEVAQCDL